MALSSAGLRRVRRFWTIELGASADAFDAPGVRVIEKEGATDVRNTCDLVVERWVAGEVGGYLTWN